MSKDTTENERPEKSNVLQSAQALAELKQYAVNESQKAARLFDSMRHSSNHGDKLHCAMCLGRKQALAAIIDRIDLMERATSTADARHYMAEDRFDRIMNETEDLTSEDVANGWHFCLEMDGLLLNANLPENDFCQCLKQAHDEQGSES